MQMTEFYKSDFKTNCKSTFYKEFGTVTGYQIQMNIVYSTG